MCFPFRPRSRSHHRSSAARPRSFAEQDVHVTRARRLIRRCRRTVELIAVGRRELRAFALGGLLAALLLALVVPPLALLHRQELPLERSLANATVTLVARLSAGSAANPIGPGAHVTDAGRFAYLGSCATCHGAKGDGRGAFGRDTYPDAADLTSPSTVAKTDAELFWIIKNGLAFTAMP